MPRDPAPPDSVRAKSRKVPPKPPFVIHCFVPLIRQPPSEGSARVSSAPASDPEPGSVRAKQPIA
jgi:hypothetical protein